MTGRWDGLPPDWEEVSRFDGGDGGCGEMLLDLRIHFRPLDPGVRVAVLASSEGAPVEIPAWCRVTGHHLLVAHPPYYLIEVRETQPEA
ncbi:MAG: sulfurtransferase TusA family protein [Candidatus Eisenbacteria bacterium]